MSTHFSSKYFLFSQDSFPHPQRGNPPQHKILPGCDNKYSMISFICLTPSVKRTSECHLKCQMRCKQKMKPLRHLWAWERCRGCLARSAVTRHHPGWPGHCRGSSRPHIAQPGKRWGDKSGQWVWVQQKCHQRCFGKGYCVTLHPLR